MQTGASLVFLNQTDTSLEQKEFEAAQRQHIIENNLYKHHFFNHCGRWRSVLLHTGCADEEENDPKALPVTLKSSWGDLLGRMGWQDGAVQGCLFYVKAPPEIPCALPPGMESGQRCRSQSVSCHRWRVIKIVKSVLKDLIWNCPAWF